MAHGAAWRATMALGSVGGALAAYLGAAHAQSDSPDATALVAEQIRQQGYVCAEPASAAQDPAVDDDAVWTLTCADATYRVRLVPDQAAQVEKLQ